MCAKPQVEESAPYCSAECSRESVWQEYIASLNVCETCKMPYDQCEPGDKCANCEQELIKKKKVLTHYTLPFTAVFNGFDIGGYEHHDDVPPEGPWQREVIEELYGEETEEELAEKEALRCKYEERLVVRKAGFQKCHGYKEELGLGSDSHHARRYERTK